jgi:phosphoenolpyruvate-protein phosphotransferase
MERTAKELVEVIAEATWRLGAEHAAIFNAHLLLLDDDEWRGEIERQIGRGIPAPIAVREVSQAVADELRGLNDDYFRERSADILDLGRRTIRQLDGVERTVLPTASDGEVVLAADELSPSDTVGLDPSVVRAIVTERGTKTSHAAILARQLGIPAVIGVEGFLAAAINGVLCAVDGDAGTCEIDPDAATAARFRVSRPVVAARQPPVSTADGVAVAVYANAASPEDVAAAVAFGADGVGLFRTELLLASPGFMYDEERQVAAYTAAAAAAEGRPVVFRTFDVGGDKPVDGLSVPGESNPFLGLRGVRLCLSRRDVFAIQLRALARVAEVHSNVEAMIPMVSGHEELDQVHALLREVGGEQHLRVGVMIEVPSAALLARELADRCDFLSVGTNDLTAYVLAADRTNAALGGFYNELHPAVLRMLALVLRAGRAAGTKVSVCGELAGDPRAVSLLVGMGLRSFSVAPPLIPELKAVLSKVDTGPSKTLAEEVLKASRVEEVEQLLRSDIS